MLGGNILKIKPIKKTLLSDQIIEEIKESILKGELKPGDRLPSERELADKMAVGRTTIREALKGVEAMGIVTRTNEGTVVNDYITSIFSDPLTQKLILKALSYKELMEVRKVLEIAMVGLAAERASDEDIQQLEEALASMQTEQPIDLDKFVEVDIAYHEAIAEATHNLVFQELFHTVRELMLEQQRKVVEDEEIIHHSLSYHQKILDAIKNRDKDMAKSLMREHLNSVETVLEKLLD